MAKPDRICLRRFVGYPTEHIGRYGDGDQFIGFAGLVWPKDPSGPLDRRFYVGVHYFDRLGFHRRTDAEFALGLMEGEAAYSRGKNLYRPATDRMIATVTALDRMQFCDINVRPFEVEIDGCVFGLLYDSDPDDGSERIVLVPGSAEFYPPWDGHNMSC